MSAPERDGRGMLRSVARQAMQERGLLPDFAADAAAQAAGFGGPAAEPGARDLTGLPWVSIDNDDSRDLDQLQAAESLGDGSVRVRVAIADVDALVKRDSPIDGHARHNTTSVYTAAQVFPMLPERLSTDLTSLVQDRERVAVVTDLVVAADGATARAEIYRARVLNQAKLAYNGVSAWLEHGARAPAALEAVAGLDAQLLLQDRVARILGQARHVRGALTLETIQTSAVFDGDVLRDLVPDRQNRAQELIENLMIAANEAAAHWLQERGFPSLRRVLRTPKRWDRIVQLAAELGDRLPPAPDPVALGAFLSGRRRTDPDRFPDLSLSIVKLLGRGEYALELPGDTLEGHFGLAVNDYMHSTAPNRRFPDLLTQRLLKAALAGAPPPYSPDELRDLAAHCTAQEDQAAKVERRVSKSAAALLLAARTGERFDAIVTGASPDGTWARIFAPPVEGRVVRGFGGLDVGQRVRLRLLHTDVVRGFIDFARES